jgi:hypothetical protein
MDGSWHFMESRMANRFLNRSQWLINAAAKPAVACAFGANDRGIQGFKFSKGTCIIPVIYAAYITAFTAVSKEPFNSIWKVFFHPKETPKHPLIFSKTGDKRWSNGASLGFS